VTRRGAGAARSWLRRCGWRLALVVVVALAVRTLWVLGVHAKPVSDYLFYYQAAVSLAHRHGYQILGHPTGFFPPGYPAFLAPFLAFTHDSITFARGSGILLGGLSAGLAFALGDRLGGRNAGLIAGLIFALAPDYVVYGGLLASENLMIPILLGACLYLGSFRPARVNWERGLILGVLLGAGVLVKPTAAVVVPVFFVYLWVEGGRRGVAGAAVMVAAAALVCAPWVARNAVVMHEVTISTNGGYTLRMGLDPLATGGPTLKGGNPEWPITTQAGEAPADVHDRDLALSWLVHHPVAATRLVPLKFYYLFRWTNGLLNSSAENARSPLGPEKKRALAPTEHSVLRFMTHHLWVWMSAQYAWLIVGAAGLGLAVARRRPAADAILMTVAAWVIVNATLFHGQARFLVSVSPLLAPCIGYLLVSLAGLARRPARAAAAAGPGGAL
jgi:4-amino-4-deoxy-L-arabinose transferase-like glycosyltransferase